MYVFPIASSSEGNCTYIRTRHTGLLIDCGISLRGLMASIGPDDMRRIDAIIITHEHGDHVKGLGAIGRKLAPTPVYIHPNSARCIRQNLKKVNLNPLWLTSEIKLNDITISPFQAVHDTAEAVGFFIEETAGVKMVYLTDSGFVSPSAKNYFEKASALFIESNYDEIGLDDFPEYPLWHKNRIRKTHLCNDQTLDVIEKHGVNSFDTIIMGHLSPRTNRPHWVQNGFERRFPDFRGEFVIAPTETPIQIKSG